jgi:hypothetical protein
LAMETASRQREGKCPERTGLVVWTFTVGPTSSIDGQVAAFTWGTKNK